MSIELYFSNRLEKLAEKFASNDHGFGQRRVPMETNYYENWIEIILIWSVSAQAPSSASPQKALKPPQEESTSSTCLSVQPTSMQAPVLYHAQMFRAQELSTYMGLQVADFPNMFIEWISDEPFILFFICLSSDNLTGNRMRAFLNDLILLNIKFAEQDC